MLAADLCRLMAGEGDKKYLGLTSTPEHLSKLLHNVYWLKRRKSSPKT